MIVHTAKPYDNVRDRIGGMGGEVTIEYANADAVAARVPADRLNELMALPEVELVEKDYMVPPPEARGKQTGPTSLPMDGLEVLNSGQLASDLGWGDEGLRWSGLADGSGEPATYYSYLTGVTNAIDTWGETDAGASSLTAVIDSGVDASHTCLFDSTGSSRVVEGPDFSPDGRSVAYQSNAAGEFDVWVVAADGSAGPALLVKLNTRIAGAAAPDWSPGGRSLAYRTSKAVKVLRLGGLDRRPVDVVAKQVDGRVAVSVTSRADGDLKASVGYELFDSESVRVRKGPVGQAEMRLKPGEAIDCELDFGDVPVHGECVVKLTAVTDDARRDIALVDLSMP